MSSTVADQLLERLSQWGVKRVFGYPGDGINGIMGAMGRRAEAFDYIRVRHEEMAAFMAGAHAKFTGEVGVCLATSGPGAIHLLNGLYDARMDHQPVLAIVGQQAATALGSDYQQEVDLQSLFKDVSAYVETVVSPAQLLHVLDRALRVAVGERQVATVIVPNDVQQMAAPKRQPHEHGHVMSAVGFVQPRPYARDADLEAAAAILNRGRRVAILAGAGALGAHRQLEAVAERLAAGVAKALLGKAAVSDDLPYVTGSIGLLGTRASSMLMEHCDTLLIVGSTFPYSEFLPKAGQARAVQIDLYPRNIGIRYLIDQALLGDAGETLERLLPLLEQKKHGARPKSQPTRSTRSGYSVPCRSNCRTMRFSAATAARIPTGTPATSACARACSARCRASWRPWAAACPTPSPPSSPIRSGRWWRWSATAPCR